MCQIFVVLTQENIFPYLRNQSSSLDLVSRPLKLLRKLYYKKYNINFAWSLKLKVKWKGTMLRDHCDIAYGYSEMVTPISMQHFQCFDSSTKFFHSFNLPLCTLQCEQRRPSWLHLKQEKFVLFCWFCLGGCTWLCKHYRPLEP